ncbi:MAG: adenylosuccinate synthase, partial [Acidobacteria bacterium]|nr:adenylosuccinate synthase [Acidobacteriota bacterium]
MPGLAVVGTQWGDEGKGKFVDILAPRFHTVVRFGGGHNAGHTVVTGGREFILHLLPSAVLHPGVRSIVGNGCVVDPLAFFEEVEMLEAAGRDPSPDLLLSDRAQIILPVHRAIEAREEERLGKHRIGTTRRGIGPAYADKAARRGLRLGDLRHPDYRDERLAHLIAGHGELLGWSESRIAEEVAGTQELLDRFAARVLPLIADTSLVIHETLEAGHGVLFEGAQATLLDLDHGTYPFVTSSTAVAAGAAVGAGVGPGAVGRVLGVSKAYMTRVGAGPF